MELGTKLRTLRAKKNYTVESLAEVAGVSPTTYRRFERDEASPTMDTVEKLAKFYEIDLLEFIEDSRTASVKEETSYLKNKTSKLISQVADLKRLMRNIGDEIDKILPKNDNI